MIWRVIKSRRFICIALLVCAVMVVAWAPEAIARVGGGNSFGGGGGSSGGGGGGGGGGVEVLYLLIRIAIEYPIVGVPLLIIFIILAATGALDDIRKKGKRRAYGGSTIRRRNAEQTALIKKLDPGFSEPVLLDYIQLLHQRTVSASLSKDFSALVPFVSEMAQVSLKNSVSSIDEINEVVLGGIEIKSARRVGGQVKLKVELIWTRLETHNNKKIRARITDQWTMLRKTSATSPAPQTMLAFCCPNCANPVETDQMGLCTSCGTTSNSGEHQWVLSEINHGNRQQYRAPQVGFLQGGDEPSYSHRTLAQTGVNAKLRALQSRHSDFKWGQFEERVSHCYYTLQSAWSDNEWSRSRPFTTDPMYHNLHFWIQRYHTHNMQNKLDDVKLLKVDLVKIQKDAWYESITVRIYGAMKDYVVDTSTGKVIGGNNKRSRRFSEYWTFLRAAGTGGSTSDNQQCPSCAAPLDKINAAGICGYCDSVITRGEFDWVLSRIDQTTGYKG